MEQTLNTYLDRVDRYLRPMPASERADIVKEIQSEMLELEAAGLTPQEIAGRLGEPKELAAAYLSDAIVKNPTFSWRRLGSIIAFYSLAGLAGMIVLPAASITAVTFLVFGAVVPALGLLGFLASLAGINVPWVMVQLGSWTAPPALAFPLTVITGFLLLLAGRRLWKFTVDFVRMLGQKRRKLA
ncbi:MAG: DUF1700 domain-containing protein [Oscillospiraceae bacterium]|nr:DUF1700 domain-containing protein [Oscillospiraceae bacterium]